MTDYFFTHSLVIPAGTAIATPFRQNKPLEDAILDRVQIRIPAGHVGLTGFALFWSTEQVWPTIRGSWAIGDNEQLEWTPGTEVTATGLAHVGYNLDKFAHTFYTRFWLSKKVAQSVVSIESPQAGSAPPAAVPATIGQLAGSLTVADVQAAAQLQLPSYAVLSSQAGP
jgi:hypothetical protein